MSAKFLNIFLYALLCLLLAVDCQAPIDHKSTISSDAQPACLTSDSECKLSSENGNPITEHGGKQECFLVNGERIPVQSIDDFDCKQLDFCSDREGFEAILYLHRQLDDDANGNIDVSESDEFLRDELKYENGAERQKAFHGNDKHISVEELWNAWKRSAVHNWTVEQTIDWLCDYVDLPKYKERFLKHTVNGVALPRLAANSAFFAVLGINNPIHKQKLTLKAMDVVLFGVPKPNTVTKDLLLCCLVVFAVGVGWYAYRLHKSSQTHVRKMIKHMESLASAEKQLEILQSELDKKARESETREKLDRSLDDNHLENSEDLVNLSSFEKKRIMALESELHDVQTELKRYQDAYEIGQCNPQLQQFLQLTYEIEIKNYNLKKAAAEAQMQAAREGCEKLRKKRSSILGAFRMAHGLSVDSVDSTILQARNLINELTKEMEERIKRWDRIESLCHCDIIHNPGLRNLESVLYGKSHPLASLPSTASITSGQKSLFLDDDQHSLLTASFISSNGNILPMNNASSISSNLYGASHSNSYSPVSIGEENEFSFEDYRSVSKIMNGKKSLPTSLTLTSIPANQSGSELNRPKTGHLKKNNLSNYRRGSSDGVERHFEEINGNSSPKVTSKSDDSIINSFSSVCDEENYKIKYAEFDVHETQSSSSESASHPPSHGLKSKSFDLNSSQNSSSKKRGLFGLRKRKSKIDK